jgi:hypothetical protein
MRPLFLLISVLFVFGCSEKNSREKIKFNHEEWLQGNMRVRGKMVDNIIEDSILIGKSKIEVLELLGDQEDTTGNLSYAVDIGLKTGPFGWGGVWPFNLNIHFDSLINKVVEVRCND